jgi:hypothetical protein
MADPLYSVIYTSRAVRPFSVEDLDKLLERARKYNQTRGITGMLVHLAGSFMQVLEGPKDSVARLFSEKISCDGRHGLIEVVTRGPVGERKFGEWTMAFRNLDEESGARPEGFSDFVKQGFTTETASDHKAVSAAILNSFRRKFGPQDESWGAARETKRFRRD